MLARALPVANQTFEVLDVVHDAAAAEKLRERRIVRVHAHDHSGALGNGKEFVQESVKMVPESFRGDQLSARSRSRIERDRAFDIGQAKLTDLGSAPFRHGDRRADPVGAGHEVVA